LSLPVVVAALMWIGVTAYALLGGADFGGGFWDLVASSSERGASERALIERSIGPVWEANHVWLIFAIVVLWTGFPAAFAAIASTLYLPLTAVAFGVILRGAGFAFRSTVRAQPLDRLFGKAFALSSVITPYFLGAVAGAVASGRVPPGNASGDVLTSWINPTSVFGGCLAVGVCAYLAAVYLTADARRRGSEDLAELFRRRGLAAGVMVGVMAAVGLVVLRLDARRLYEGLTHRGLPLVVASGIFGFVSLELLHRRRYTIVRVTAGLAVLAVVWGWGVGQYPYMLERSLTVSTAAAPPATLKALVVSLAVGALLLIPSLAWLFVLFQRERART
jgi:cytochrome bd ubiquinol oxidase subunit II